MWLFEMPVEIQMIMKLIKKFCNYESIVAVHFMQYLSLFSELYIPGALLLTGFDFNAGMAR